MITARLFSIDGQWSTLVRHRDRPEAGGSRCASGVVTPLLFGTFSPFVTGVRAGYRCLSDFTPAQILLREQIVTFIAMRSRTESSRALVNA